MSTVPQTIQCVQCQAEHALADMVKEATVREGLREVFLECPSCGKKIHSHFVSDALLALRQKIDTAKEAFQRSKTQATWTQYKTAQGAYRRAFDKLNKRWRRKLGIVRPEATAVGE